MEQLIEIFELGRQIGHEEKLCHTHDYPHESCHQRLAAKLSTIMEDSHTVILSEPPRHNPPAKESPIAALKRWSQFRQ